MIPYIVKLNATLDSPLNTSRGVLNPKVFLGLLFIAQTALFTVFSMVIARLIASWGPIPIAVQKVGSQVESISWMTAGGFQAALLFFGAKPIFTSFINEPESIKLGIDYLKILSYSQWFMYIMKSWDFFKSTQKVLKPSMS